MSYKWDACVAHCTKLKLEHKMPEMEDRSLQTYFDFVFLLSTFTPCPFFRRELCGWMWMGKYGGGGWGREFSYLRIATLYEFCTCVE